MTIPDEASGTRDPLLRARLQGERRQLARIAAEFSGRRYLLPWLPQPPVGVAALASLVAPGTAEAPPLSSPA